MKWFFIVLCIYVLSLFFRTARLPDWLVREISIFASPADEVVTLGGVSFGFRSGLVVDRLSVYGRAVSLPLVSADRLRLDLFARKAFVSRLCVAPVVNAAGAQATGPCESSRDLSFDFPSFDEFELDLDRPDIMGIAPERVTCKVSSSPRRLAVRDIYLLWPDGERRMVMNGTLDADLDSGMLKAFVGGQALQRHIRPLLVSLDVPSSYPYIDAFTQVKGPVPASCAVMADLRNGDLHLDIDLAPKMGLYKRVPLDWATSRIAVDVKTRGSDLCCRTDVGPLETCDSRGRRFGGTLSVVCTNDSTRLLIDARSNLTKVDTLGIIDCFDQGTFDFLTTDEAPQISARGRVVINGAPSEETDLRGRVETAYGALFSLPGKNISFDYRFCGDRVTVTNAVLEGVTQGRVTGVCELAFPGLETHDATFDADVRYDDMRLQDLAQVFEVVSDRRDGNVSGRLRLSGRLAPESFARSLCGSSEFNVKGGHLSQVPLFAGLTELLAEYVPGVSSIVNQGDASGTFKLADGIMTTSDFCIEGNLFSIKASGSYDIAADRLDFVFRTRFMRNDSFLKMLVRPITWPFSKLLMEFRLTGSVSNPRWEYINILDRVL